MVSILFVINALSVIYSSISISLESLESGDLVFIRPHFQKSKYNAFDDAILVTGVATVRWMKTNGYPLIGDEIASHVAMAWRDAGEGGDRIQHLSFIQALPDLGVILTPADEFIYSVPLNSTLYAATVVDPYVRRRSEQAAQVALSQVGKPYASNFESPPTAFYCSSLIDWAYASVADNSGNGEVLCPKDFVLIFAPEKYWTDYYENLEPPQSLPQNITGSNPTLLLHSKKLFFSVLTV
jgi:hypothetical protein